MYSLSSCNSSMDNSQQQEIAPSGRILFSMRDLEAETRTSITPSMQPLMNFSFHLSDRFLVELCMIFSASLCARGRSPLSQLLDSLSLNSVNGEKSSSDILFCSSLCEGRCAIYLTFFVIKPTLPRAKLALLFARCFRKFRCRSPAFLFSKFQFRHTYLVNRIIQVFQKICITNSLYWKNHHYQMEVSVAPIGSLYLRLKIDE